MPEFSRTIIGLFGTLMPREAPDQGGLLSGHAATIANVNTSDPLRLWIIQVGVIVATASLLSLLLRKVRQPKVIAEVLGGILLGPTAFGRIPGFTNHIFPDDSKPYLSLVANIGLVLFLFIVGLEIDSTVVKRNAKLSASIAIAGMVVPFGLGAGLSVPLYHEFIDPSVKFTHFMLFTGVAYSITAFPVLCRILTEVKLLDTTVGIVVLSSGVGNDIVGWTLLALSVALVNASSGLTALYILLLSVGWTLFLLFPVKIALLWLARKTGSIENGPSMMFMTCVMFTVFTSAFMTDVIGVHSIFGAFLAGLIVPREGSLTVLLTEKLEDIVSIVFIPLYFALSGLSTNLGLLNNGTTWAYTIAIMVLAFVGKFGGCTIAAHFMAGFNWREATTIGSLMSCKGLVELIVLNVGLSANILSERVFSMFVLEALVLTFMTTPLVTVLYPPSVRKRVTAAGKFDSVAGEDTPGKKAIARTDDSIGHKVYTVVLDKLEHLPGMMMCCHLLQPSSEISAPTIPTIHALRLVELTDRLSAVMKGFAGDGILQSDPMLSIIKAFGQLNGLTIKPSLSIVSHAEFPSTIADHANNVGSEMIFLPWLPPSPTLGEVTEGSDHPLLSPLKPIPSSNHHSFVHPLSTLHSYFIRGVFANSTVDVALFVDQNGSFGFHGSSHHLYVPFCGGPDDRLCLHFAAQLCSANKKISCTVVRYLKSDAGDVLPPPSAQHTEINTTIASMSPTAFPDTIYENTTTTRMISDSADNIEWAKYTSPSAELPSPVSREALTRMTFTTQATPLPLHTMIADVNTRTEKGLLIVTGRSRRLAVDSHRQELKQLMAEYRSVDQDVIKTIGEVATAFLASSNNTAMIIIQASNRK